MTEFNLDWMSIAEDVARKAGYNLKVGYEKGRKINFQDATDVKLQADIESEHLIRELLTKHTHLPIIGEEEGGDDKLLKGNDFFWVVDPLDGTYNYLRNQPQTCVSIGLMQGSHFIAGIIYDFNRDELYKGSIDNGFFINNEQVQPQWAQSMNQGCLMTGFPSKMKCSIDALKGFTTKVHRFKKIRMIGSAALALATVAVGRADAYFEECICLWDIAAGASLVIAAGGHIQITRSEHTNPFVFHCYAVGRKEWLLELT